MNNSRDNPSHDKNAPTMAIIKDCVAAHLPNLVWKDIAGVTQADYQLI